MANLIIFSKERYSHAKNLRESFEKYRRFIISLNNKKCIFGTSKGRLLGHIISKHGIYIDQERVKIIQNIPYPSSLKELRSFMGKINFICKFISSFVEIIKSINDILSKHDKITWDEEACRAFQDINDGISNALILTSLDYKSSFLLYSFASEHSLVEVLNREMKIITRTPLHL